MKRITIDCRPEVTPAQRTVLEAIYNIPNILTDTVFGEFDQTSKYLKDKRFKDCNLAIIKPYGIEFITLR